MDYAKIELIRKTALLGQVVGVASAIGGTIILFQAKRLPSGPKRTAMLTAGSAVQGYGLLQAGGATLVRWILKN